MIRLVFVKLPNGKTEVFDASQFSLVPGEDVVIEEEKGLILGKVLSPPHEKEKRFLQKAPSKVIRKASPQDLEQSKENQKTEKEVFQFCQQKIREKGLEMKLVRAELFLDRSKAVFYFTSENRIDFRELVKDLAAEFRMRIEMRQIGVRDEAKMVCGLGGCGRELCCSKFMNRFELVSVKMAKEQNLALNPTKISGACGRLMCCLAYEYPTYVDLKKNLPKVGKHITTRSGKGKVVRHHALNQTVTVQLEEGGEITINASELG